jgi:hypothetical protein
MDSTKPSQKQRSMIITYTDQIKKTAILSVFDNLTPCVDASHLHARVACRFAQTIQVERKECQNIFLCALGLLGLAT